MKNKKEKKWFRLDTAALIFPAVRKKNWNNVFRISVTFKEEIDIKCLQKAADDLKKRFPTFYVRLKAGFFWYYLEEIDNSIEVKQDYAYPLTHMTSKELSNCCIRILYYKNRLAVEFFHSVSDGTGASVFVKNLAGRYLQIKYDINISHQNDILDINDMPSASELQDGFPLCSNNYSLSRKEANSYHLHGVTDIDGYHSLITGIVDTNKLIELAHSYKTTVTSFLSAVMAQSIYEIQKKERPEKFLKPVKITVPVNLRKQFNISTLRNFVLTVNVGFDPKMGQFSFTDIVNQISHQLAMEATPQRMASRVASNVIPQRMLLIRIAPLFIKDIILSVVYSFIGERKGCINISNLGNIEVPEEMKEYIERFEFIIGVQYSYPNNCSVASYNGRTYINMIRNIEETELERLFFSKLVCLGLAVEIESNERR